jgi:hypothetical protein
MATRHTVAVLDACVLFPFTLRDALLRAAAKGETTSIVVRAPFHCAPVSCATGLAGLREIPCSTR